MEHNDADIASHELADSFIEIAEMKELFDFTGESADG
jgi:hypothetical protein